MNDILDKVNELVELIKNSPDYIKYIELKSKIENDNEISKLIEDIKYNQRKIVMNLYDEMENKKLQENIDKALEILNNYPIYSEFCYLQEDLNIMFQNIKKTIEQHINNITN